MMHPIAAVQTRLVAALAADATLAGLLGSDAVFDAPPKHKTAPYVVIARHDVLAHDTDLVTGNEHRLLLHVWASQASRSAVLAIVEAMVAALLAVDLSDSDWRVTLAEHLRTDTDIDPKSGQARAAVSLRLFSELA
ncbi:DUF3168 domain-containing protein [Devosia algicola]|uniref:DUF3168 domain-containing protein n=1 Tax=Devosia algicola TaxID=3026418 RepID=A0ABY7YN65_9HYPH|nr:DUF3168 domain-containing protein [Devosia algicola]WDR02751.1 DUF3168 domain-containing protein [Devosia algicola]